MIRVAETENSGRGTSPPAVASTTRVVPRETGSVTGATASPDARFRPPMARMLPGPKDALGLNVTASNTESVRSDSGSIVTAVTVTDNEPLDATTCTVDPCAGSVRTTLAIPES